MDDAARDYSASEKSIEAALTGRDLPKREGEVPSPNPTAEKVLLNCNKFVQDKESKWRGVDTRLWKDILGLRERKQVAEKEQQELETDAEEKARGDEDTAAGISSSSPFWNRAKIFGVFLTVSGMEFILTHTPFSRFLADMPQELAFLASLGVAGFLGGAVHSGVKWIKDRDPNEVSFSAKKEDWFKQACVVLGALLLTAVICIRFVYSPRSGGDLFLTEGFYAAVQILITGLGATFLANVIPKNPAFAEAKRRLRKKSEALVNLDRKIFEKNQERRAQAKMAGNGCKQKISSSFHTFLSKGGSKEYWEACLYTPDFSLEDE